jgi:hypothetical protein
VAFRIQPHMRLHEWVAEEAGFFRDEGLEYEFEADGFAAGTAMGEMVTPAGEQPVRGLEPFLDRGQIALQFAGRPYDRLRLLLDPAQERTPYDETVLV